MHRANKTKPDNKYRFGLMLLILALLVLFGCSLFIGKYSFGLDDLIGNGNVAQLTAQRLFNMRLLRAVASVLIGAALAVSGCIYQSMFHNPLASPDILGVQAGACVGASLMLLTGAGTMLIIPCSFVFGLLAVSMCAGISLLFKEQSKSSLILSGIIVGGLAKAILGLMKFLADQENALTEIVFWELGSIAKVSDQSIFSVMPIILVCLVAVIIFRYKLDYLDMSDSDAVSLGVNIKLLKVLAVLFSTLLAASSIAVAGNVSWIGLIIPQLAGIFSKGSYNRSVTASALLGAIFLLTADLLARNVSSMEIPISIVTGIMGIPLLLMIIIKRGLDKKQFI